MVEERAVLAVDVGGSHVKVLASGETESRRAPSGAELTPTELGGGLNDVFRDGTLKVQPLCYDVTVGGMVAASELRRTDLPMDGRIFYVNNNPIAAPAGHPILQGALARATDSLLGDEPAPEIQSTTGPGNLTAALAAHAREAEVSGIPLDFELLLNWEETSEPCWDLAYRSDGRNWRNMELR